MIQKKLETGEFLVEYNEKNSKRVILVCPGLVYYKSGPHFWLSNLINKIANTHTISLSPPHTFQQLILLL